MQEGGTKGAMSGKSVADVPDRRERQSTSVR